MEYDFKSTLFSEFSIYQAKAKKLSHFGRASGGVMLLVKKLYEQYTSYIESEYENVIVLRLAKGIFGTNKDLLLVCAYIPPHDSPYWNSAEHGYGIEVLEQFF